MSHIDVQCSADEKPSWEHKQLRFFQDCTNYHIDLQREQPWHHALRRLVLRDFAHVAAPVLTRIFAVPFLVEEGYMPDEVLDWLEVSTGSFSAYDKLTFTAKHNYRAYKVSLRRMSRMDLRIRLIHALLALINRARRVSHVCETTSENGR